MDISPASDCIDGLAAAAEDDASVISPTAAAAELANFNNIIFSSKLGNGEYEFCWSRLSANQSVAEI